MLTKEELIAIIEAIDVLLKAQWKALYDAWDHQNEVTYELSHQPTPEEKQALHEAYTVSVIHYAIVGSLTSEYRQYLKSLF